MKRFKRRKKKIISSSLIIISLIFFLTFLIYKTYIHKSSSKLIEVSFIKINEFMDSFLSNNINYDLLKNDLKDIIIINKNNEGEILYVSYDLNQAYYALEVVTEELETKIGELESGLINTQSDNIINGKKGIMLSVPLFIGSNNIFLSNLGPNIYIPIKFVGSLLTNIKTKITDYGLNNALVEIYVTISIKSNLISPMVNDYIKTDYDCLIASTIINGRVPTVYGGIIESESNNFSIPLE